MGELKLADPSRVDPNRPRRSVLFMPASNPRAIEKARSLPCDVVVLDLEDAVAPADKPAARAAMAAAIAAGGWGARELVVRINALGTAWGHDDLAAAAGADAVLVPKADAVSLAAAHAAAPTATLWAMVETARAAIDLPALAAVPGVAALVVGTNDLARELRCVPGADRLPLWPHLAMTVAAARAHGLVVLDGVYNAIDDAEGLAAECAQGARFGFDGKSLIHPSQIAAANAAFAPDPDAVAAAAALIAAWAAAGGDAMGVVKIAGRMVERLHVDQAEALVARAEAIARAC
jgi:citrate lyase subunit beta/citryl-CoA lyase